MGNIIELKDVIFSALEGNVIHGITAGFEEGKTTAIVGPSGSGKSTVLKLAAGLLLPKEGEALFDGRNISHMSRSENLEFRRKSAFVFQDSALWANQNLYQILELPLRIHYPDMNKKDRDSRIQEVAAQVGYRKDLNIRPARLSMGEQKLIAFARALLCSPILMFLDEWVESLDETNANRLLNIVRKKQKENVTVIFVCHDMRIIQDLAEYITIIVDGKKAHHLTMEEVVNDAELSNYLRMGIAL